MRLVAYTCAGLEEQNEGLDIQQTKIEEYCLHHKHTLLGIESDTISTSNNKRPGLHRLLSKLRDDDVEGVIISGLNRLTHKVTDLGVLLEVHFSKKTLISISEQCDTSTPAGALALEVLISVAKWERGRISDRTAAVLAQKRNNGHRVGHIPFGWRLAGQGPELELDPNEQKIIALAIDFRDDGRSWHWIATTLNKRGYSNRKERAWNKDSTRRALGSKF